MLPAKNTEVMIVHIAMYGGDDGAYGHVQRVSAAPAGYVAR